MRRSHKLWVGSFIVATVAFSLAALLFANTSVHAAGLSNIAPNPDASWIRDSSGAYTIQNTGGSSPDPTTAGVHTFLIRRNVQSGGKQNINNSVDLQAYYTNTDNWGSRFLRIYPADGQCDKWLAAGISGSVKNSFVTVTITDSAGTNTYNINYDTVCSGWNAQNDCEGGTSYACTTSNRLFARYKFPGNASDITLDPNTSRYLVEINISYNTSITPGNVDTQNNAIKMVVAAYDDPTTLTPKVKIGPIGHPSKPSYDFPIIARDTYRSKVTKIVVPFGLKCSTNSAQSVQVGLYDADNGTFGQDVRFRVEDIDSDTPIKINGLTNSDTNPADFGTNGSPKWVRPVDGDAGKTLATIMLQPQTRYQLQVVGMSGGNTVVLSLPSDTIFGDITCPSATLTSRANAVIDGTTYTPSDPVPSVATGTAVDFYNWVVTSNVNNTGVATFAYNVATSSLPGSGNTETQGDATYSDPPWSIYPAEWKPADRHIYSIILNTPGQYCRKTNILAASVPAYAVVRNDPATVCVNVVNGNQVKLQGVVKVGPQTETTTDAKIDAHVSVSGVPAGSTFNMTCTWGSVPNVDAGSVTVLVSGNGPNYCQHTVHGTGTIGQKLCVTMTPSQPSGWASNPPSGVWTFVANPGNGCTSFVGKPYLKVYGGDVRTGRGAANPDGACTTSDDGAAGIKTLNNDAAGNYTGAGVQYAAFAMDGISGFASSQYINTPNLPKYLTFANTAADTYGGNFDAAPGCQDFDSGLPAANGDLTLSAGTAAPASSKVVNGNVYIIGSQIYSTTSWASTQAIPYYRLVVHGNIYIGKGVKQLDGLYIATPDGDGNGGNIYTCANGIGAVETTTLNGCNSQLVVNGAFIAEKVFFERDCGSLVYSKGGDSYVNSGGAANQETCGANHAAEVFNYSPELWLPATTPSTSGTYNAITALPPVL